MRASYETVVLGTIIAITLSIAFWRFAGERRQFHLVKEYVFTGTVASVVLDAPRETRVNINRATHEELVALPGVTAQIATEILLYRDAQPFEHVAELIRIRGIGERRLATLVDHVWCGPPAIQYDN